MALDRICVFALVSIVAIVALVLFSTSSTFPNAFSASDTGYVIARVASLPHSVASRSPSSPPPSSSVRVIPQANQPISSHPVAVLPVSVPHFSLVQKLFTL